MEVEQKKSAEIIPVFWDIGQASSYLASAVKIPSALKVDENNFIYLASEDTILVYKLKKIAKDTMFFTHLINVNELYEHLLCLLNLTLSAS